MFQNKGWGSEDRKHRRSNIAATPLMFVIFLLSFSCLVTVSTPSVANSFKDAKAALSREDYKQALELLMPLAQHGHASAQYLVGKMYHRGNGVRRNEREAFNWYKQSAEVGNADAELQLGFMYLYARGVQGDTAEALKWLHKSAQQGNVTAQFNLGQLYDTGLNGVQINPKEAAMWYRMAAERGSSLGQSRLSRLYQMGSGLKQDWNEAYFWWCLSVSKGLHGTFIDYAPGAKRVTQEELSAAQTQKLEQHLSPKQIAAVKRRVKTWKPIKTIEK